MQLISNVINHKHLSDLYMSILDDLSDILVRSYGPYGSNSLIQKGPDTFPIYTKDGHTILSNVKYHNIVERTITSNILSITEYIVKNVGDGTTSAVLLSRYILEGLLRYQKDIRESDKPVAPVTIIRVFKDIVEKMVKIIQSHAQDFSVEDTPFYISMISTNGDNDISNRIQQLYKDLGKDVYISLETTSQKEDILSIYDGLVLESGLIEECYINDPEKKTCQISTPHVYTFTDPIDTPEMILYFETIVKRNIYDPLTWKKTEEDPEAPPVIPTVIIAPRISRDASVFMEQITGTMSKMTGGMVRHRPPLLIITNLDSVDQDQYSDIMTMCGCPPIRKYINPEIQKKDQEAGTAPTIHNVERFYGTCDMVEADNYKTSFFNPALMFDVSTDSDGNIVKQYSAQYKSLIGYLENELSIAKENKADYTEIHHLKKRLNSLKAVFVEWHVGGVSPSDRDQRMSTIEDAVKNCRSAARDGVGMGANMEGLRAILTLMDTDTIVPSQEEAIIRRIIMDAYIATISELYKYYFLPEELDSNICKMALEGKALNLSDPDNPVISSIQSDIMILEGISNLITIMATSNQYICPQPMDTTVYRADEAIRLKKEEEQCQAWSALTET